jgi:CubicO group peptidase (beta-lactamase class C family)
MKIMHRKMVRLIVTALALLFATGTHATQSVPAAGSARGPASSIDKVLSDAVARRDIPGVVAIVADARSILYQGAFGLSDVQGSKPMTVDAIFRIASMTKPVTSVAAMQLVEQGRLRLDDPAEKYLPELANLQVFETFDAQAGNYTVRPATKTLTVRHLLTHSSGLGYNFTSQVVRDFKPRSGEQYPAGPLLFEPGEQWLYGTSTDWVGRLVETMSGQTLDAYFREHIFRPLGMVDTFYNVPDDRQNRLVAGHRRRADGAYRLEPTQPMNSITRFNGGGGLASTATDYIRFLQMFLNRGTGNGVRILSSNTVSLMGQNHIGDVGVRALETALPERSSDFSFIANGRDKWGLGFLITAAQERGKRSAGSLSWGGIWNTYFWIDPTQGIAGVVLMQYLPFADSKALAVHDSFERAVYQLTTVLRQ